MDSIKINIVGWASEICIVAEMLHYTVYHTGRIGRVTTRVFDLKLSEVCFCWKLRLHGLSHGQPKPCLKPCLCLSYGTWALYSCCVMCLWWWNVWLIECWDTCCWDVLLRLCLVFLLRRICAIWIEKWIEVVELSPCLGANCELWLWWDWIEMMIQ